MKKEFVKLISIIIFLSVCIILISGNPIIKSVKKETPQLALISNRTIPQDAYLLQEAFVDVINQVKLAVVSITAVYTYKVEVPDFYFSDPFENFFREFF